MNEIVLILAIVFMVIFCITLIAILNLEYRVSDLETRYKIEKRIQDRLEYYAKQ